MEEIELFDGFESAKPTGSSRKLPKGGYVLKVMGTEVTTSKYGQAVKISFDVSEGDYKDFFRNDYKSQTSDEKKWRGVCFLNVPKNGDPDWAIQKFLRITKTVFPESNPGFVFTKDVSKLKGKIFGGIFVSQPFSGNDGKTHYYTKFKNFETVQNIRSGNYVVPEVDAPKSSGGVTTSADGFMNIPDSADGDDLPFI